MRKLPNNRPLLSRFWGALHGWDTRERKVAGTLWFIIIAGAVAMVIATCHGGWG